MSTCELLLFPVYLLATNPVWYSSIREQRTHFKRLAIHLHPILSIIIIMRISRAPMYHTRWEHRTLYNNVNHTHTHTHTHTHSALDEGIGTAVKNSSEIIIKQVRLEDGFKREGRIRVAECLR